MAGVFFSPKFYDHVFSFVRVADRLSKATETQFVRTGLAIEVLDETTRCSVTLDGSLLRLAIARGLSPATYEALTLGGYSLALVMDEPEWGQDPLRNKELLLAKLECCFRVLGQSVEYSAERVDQLRQVVLGFFDVWLKMAPTSLGPEFRLTSREVADA